MVWYLSVLLCACVHVCECVLARQVFPVILIIDHFPSPSPLLSSVHLLLSSSLLSSPLLCRPFTPLLSPLLPSPLLLSSPLLSSPICIVLLLIFNVVLYSR